MSATKEAEANMKAAIEHLKEELKNIRTGRANPALLDKIKVQVYGAPMRLRDIANITTPEPRQLLVTPFDANNAGMISKAIDAANLGVQPVHDGNAVRITIPMMDETVRKEMVKMCGRKCEEAKVSIRNGRRDANDLIKKQKSDGDIGEDIMKKLEKEIQDLTDKFCAEADTVSKAKEVEVMEV